MFIIIKGIYAIGYSERDQKQHRHVLSQPQETTLDRYGISQAFYSASVRLPVDLTFATVAAPADFSVTEPSCGLVDHPCAYCYSGHIEAW